MSNSQKVLIAELTACEQCEPEVRAILSEYATHVRTEPGNIVFDCYQVEDDSKRFVVYEIYENEAAFQAHLSASKNAEINERLSAVTEGGSSLMFLTGFA